MDERVLIVNADDFGASPGVNDGVIRAFEHGIVTSASLMVRHRAAASAASYARSESRMSLGLHLDLGEWTLDAEERDWRPLYTVVSLDDAEAVRRAAAGQLAAFRALVGRNPTHLDSHQHVHRREPVRSVLAAIAENLGVPLRHDSPDVTYCGDFYGQTADGASRPDWIGAARLVALVASLRRGATELCCHPSAADDLDTLYRTERLRELEALCDPAVRAALVAHNVRLCSFAELQVAR